MASPDFDQEHINNLPNGIHQEIFSYLPLEDRKTAALVCRLWEQEAFSVRLLTNVQLCVTCQLMKSWATTISVLRNSTRKYRNVIFRLCDGDICSHVEYPLIVDVLNQFGSTIEGFVMKHGCSANRLKRFADRMPNLKSMTAYVTELENLRDEPIKFPEDNILKNQQFDMLRVAPNLQQLRIFFISSKEHVRALEMLKAYANQLKMLDLRVLYAWLPIDELRLEKMEILKLQGGSREFEVHRLHRLLKRLRELKAVHLGINIYQSTLEVISSSCPKLNTLDIRSDYLEVGALKHLNNMPNLQTFMVNRLHETFLEVSEPVIVGIKELHLLVGSTALSNHAYANKLAKVFPHTGSLD
nr:uncharacterized protein LOC115268091 [Aedes albopictus]